MSRRALILIGVVATVVLAGVSTLVIAAAADGFGHHRRFFGAAGAAASCTAPNLIGTVVDVTLMNMGGPMKMDRGSIGGGVMRLMADHATVPAGSVSFLVVNGGSIPHELVILPLPANQLAGTRKVGGDGRIDETGSVGEASDTCGAGSGEGIAPGASSWTTVNLQPGRYELLCNFPGHYAAGMYAQLTVE
jgi:uncharacterized cupredoxin-like copper-binding protein